MCIRDRLSSRTEAPHLRNPASEMTGSFTATLQENVHSIRIVDKTKYFNTRLAVARTGPEKTSVHLCSKCPQCLCVTAKTNVHLCSTCPQCFCVTANTKFAPFATPGFTERTQRCRPNGCHDFVCSDDKSSQHGRPLRKMSMPLRHLSLALVVFDPS